MGSEIEITETPNWLKELEAKREKRLKTKLGHELGAGAPCLTCDSKCPGLDLHFWRKICKNCKCSKENHEVQDDDIYGWAQDELLGTKVNRLKKKIVLPGRKDEVELEWAPNGPKETIDKYLETLPTNLLPIKGSQAAQDRKQLLKKQIPIHDIDPTLCHDLTDEELKKMHDYISHVKQASVGVGRLIQVNLGKGTKHVLDKNDAMFLINNVPKGISTSENVLLKGNQNTVPLKNLANKLNNLRLANQRELITQSPNSLMSSMTDEQNPVHSGIRDIRYEANELPSSGLHHSFREKLSTYNPENNTMFSEDFRDPHTKNSQTLSYPENNLISENQVQTPYQNPYGSSNVKNLVPSAFVPVKMHSNENYINDGRCSKNDLIVGTARDLPYPSNFINDDLKYGRKLPHYNSQSYNTLSEHLNPAYFEPIKDIKYSSSESEDSQRNYHQNSVENDPNSSNRKQFDSDENIGHSRPLASNYSQIGGEVPKTRNEHVADIENVLKPTPPLPHLTSRNANISDNEVKPIKINSLRDLAHSTYENPADEFSKDHIHDKGEMEKFNSSNKAGFPGFRPLPSPVPPMHPSFREAKNSFQNKGTPTKNLGTFDNELSPYHKNVKSPIIHNVKSEEPQGNNQNMPMLSGNVDAHRSKYAIPKNHPSNLVTNEIPSYAPEDENIWEDRVQPSAINIGAIRDIEYENPIVKTALARDNEFFEGAAPNKFLPDLDTSVLPSCHYCQKKFKQDELAIAIPERSEAIFHTDCFKCCGCNQILADMFYFYDKAGDNIYCGRDYAKIRGIPRCKACDELIFVKEYCLAENCTFHVKHFCCFECDTPLAGQNYVIENDQPFCVPCYELTKANKCYACKEVIHPDQQGLQLKDNVHFHATDNCFACKICQKSLFGAKLLFRNDCLYCSHDCFNNDV